MRLLGPVMTNGRPPEFYEQMRSLAAALKPDDQSLDAIYLRGANIGWRDWAAAVNARTRLQRQWATLFKAMGRRALPGDADGGVQARSFES
jgi:amidase